MRARWRAPLVMAVAAVMVVVAACGGDDSKAEKKSGNNVEATATTASASSSATGSTGTSSGSAASTQSGSSSTTVSSGSKLAVDCGTNIKAFKFDGKLALQTQQASNASATDFGSLLSSILSDVKYTGAYVAPDRTQLKAEFASKDSPIAGPLEVVQIGADSYTKLGNTAWQKGGAGGPADFLGGLDPREFCKSVISALPTAPTSRKEKANGVDATRYDYDRSSIAKLQGVTGGLTGGELPENFKLSVWVSDKEQFPVKMALSGSGTNAGQPYALDLQLNVSDLNSGSIKIDAPK